jgi:hypothetical protein
MMLGELRFSQESESDDEPEVELLTVYEEAGRVCLSMGSKRLSSLGVFRLSRKDEAELLSYLMQRLFVAEPPRDHDHIGPALSAPRIQLPPGSARPF